MNQPSFGIAPKVDNHEEPVNTSISMIPALVRMVSGAAAAVLVATGLAWAAPAEAPPWIDPLSPADSATQIQVPPGYRVELVASEPDIEEPTLCVFDADGRMYVAEMLSYMQDTEGTGTKEFRGSRVKRLEDTDGDGKMDKVTVFADGLLLPRMVLPLDDRVIIQETDIRDLVMYRDTDGDGKADEKTVVWKSPKEGGASVEHQDSGLVWNLDNWIYTAQGRFRHRFTNGTWVTEPTAPQTSLQWGLGMDDEGTMFFSHNSYPGRGFQQPFSAWNLWLKRTGGKTPERPTLGVGYAETDAAFHRLYPIHAVGDRQNKVDTGWTSACGVSVYRGDAMPDLYGDMFICEPCGHLVRRAKVDVVDGRKNLRNAHQDEQKEFFASKDFYTRPVWTANGPDGGLYIVDMYRGMIQDKPWVDEKFAARIKAMGADKVIRKGRIWRVVPDGFVHTKPERMLEMGSEQLIAKLADPSGWKRDQAQKLLVLRGDKAVVPALESMARSHASPLARLHALWTLEGLDALTKPVAFAALGDADPRVRSAGIRLLEPWIKQGDAETIAKLAPVADDGEITVRRQLILSLGWSDEPEARTTVEKVIAADVDKDIIYLAAMTALWNTKSPFIDRLLSGAEFMGIKDPQRRAELRQQWKQGILAWKGMKIDDRQLDPETIKLVDLGAGLYTGLCVQCHGPDGRGMQPPDSPKLAPPLDGSPRVVGQRERLVRVLLHGLVGDVDGQQYKGGIMAPMGALDDRMLAAVLSYVRQSWSNDASPILPEEVAAIRAAATARTTPWTLAELERYAAPVLGGSGIKGKANEPLAWKGYRGTAKQTELAKPLPADRKTRGPWVHLGREPGQWFAVDMLEPTEVTAIRLQSAYPTWSPITWELRVSDDGITWSEPIATGRGGRTETWISCDPVVTRFFKVVQTGKATRKEEGIWQVQDYQVHGRPVAPPAATTAPAKSVTKN